MNLQKNKLWVAISLGILSGPALGATIDCTVTPVNSILTEGQTLQLQADCNGALASINWLMDGTSVTGDVPLSGHASGKPVYYTTPVGLGGTDIFAFAVTGVPSAAGDAFGTSTTARVTVKPSSAVVAKAAGVATPTTPVDATCGTANGKAVETMPTNGEQCTAANSKPALAISGPTSFTWSCLSLTGGLEANCSAVLGYTVTGQVSGGNGTVSVFPVGGAVASGGTATVTASPDPGYSSTLVGCGGTQSGDALTTAPVTANCTVTATFSDTPMAGTCGSSNGVATLTAPAANLCGVGTPSSVTDGTGQFTWTCASTNGGATASCSAPEQYTVTASLSGTGGAVDAPTSKTVTHNATTTFSVTPDAGNAANVTATGCTASVSGNTITTGAVTGACSLTVTFAAASTCVLPANTTVYDVNVRDGQAADFGTLFDMATTLSVDSTIGAGKIKSYEFSNDKAFRNGYVYNNYSTGTKDISISSCPGVFDVPASCIALAQTTPKLYWSRDGSPWVHPTYPALTYQTCNIGTGDKVYLNIRNRNTTTIGYQIQNWVTNQQ